VITGFKSLRGPLRPMSEELAGRVQDVLSVDPDDYRGGAEADAEVVKDEIRSGTFDNHQSIVGLEYEFYAVTDGRWSEGGDGRYALARVPRRLLELIGFEKELGLHNAEMTTSPQPLSNYGLGAQMDEVRARLSAAQTRARAEGMRLVSDAMWTIPPAGETAREYLRDHVAVDGIRMATNMSDAVRYHAMANGPRAPESFALSAPNVNLEAATVLPESLITSIQPHYQVKQAVDLPNYFNYALRIAGPLLALAANSPLFPPDLYDDGVDPRDVLAEAWHEHRIAVFESVMNTGHEKVRFPDDLESVEEAVDRVAGDEVTVPMEVSPGDRFDDTFATLRHKHGTFWRWIRPVFGGATRSAANARIEFRPIGAQPTVPDSLAFQAAFAGLLESLTKREHPVSTLDWSVARANFYRAMREGLESEQRWITNDGERTTDRDRVYEDLFAHARDGLVTAGCSEAEADAYLRPLSERVAAGATPAAWKLREVETRLDDGADLADAVVATQRAYITNQEETLLEGSFVDWL